MQRTAADTEDARTKHTTTVRSGTTQSRIAFRGWVPSSPKNGVLVQASFGDFLEVAKSPKDNQLVV